jgi:hypothetical protein
MRRTQRFVLQLRGANAKQRIALQGEWRRLGREHSSAYGGNYTTHTRTDAAERLQPEGCAAERHTEQMPAQSGPSSSLVCRVLSSLHQQMRMQRN